MIKPTNFLFTIGICTLLVSCQKENSTSSSQANFLGNYKFISMQANTTTTAQATDGTDVEKTINLTNYITKENSGTIKFDETTATSTNLSYTIDTIMKTYYYINGSLEDSIEVPFQFTVPPSSSTAPYKLVGTDSIYFSSGSMFMNGSTQQTTPSGAKLRIDGDKLYMTMNVNQTSTQTQQGVVVESKAQASATITLQKM
jgi:hypothetical protein